MRAARRCTRPVTILAVSAAAVFAGGAAALAASGGGYSPSNQGCPDNADANDFQGSYPGCHNLQVLVRDGSGHTYLQAGTEQTAQGDNVHAADATVSPDGSARPTGGDDGSGLTLGADTGYQPFAPGSCALLDLLLTPVYVVQGGQPCDNFAPQPPAGPPTVNVSGPSGSTDGSTPDPTAATVYFGADDNLDTGEHDGPDGKYGSSQASDGPSDGGAVTLAWHPLAAQGYSDVLMALLTGDASGLATDPVRVASASGGACADGFCTEGTTTRQSVYQGGGAGGQQSRNVYDYSGKKWDPYDCSSGSSRDEQACDPNENYYHQQEADNVYAEPGVQVYEDPDPNGSPAFGTYPLPALYAGSCGVTAGGGDFAAPDSPVTNDAGQLSVDPAGC